MAPQLKVGNTQAYQLYREVEPVPPYPRIDPQRPRDERSPAQGDSRNSKNDHVRRRFEAMRKLIDELTTDAGIIRVAYQTAVTEMTELGFSILEAELLEQLLALKFIPDDIAGIIEQISQREILPELQPGRFLSEKLNFFPVYTAGINEYNLCFSPLHFSVSDPSPLVFEVLDAQGYFVSEKNRLRLDFRRDDTLAASTALVLTLNVLVGGSEVDDGGRRVILYQRPDQSYALYADKQIDLSI